MFIMGCLLFFFVFFAAFIAVNKLICFWCRSKVCLVGKTALITGGASGIGFQTAIALASKGCRVIIADVVDTKKPIQDIAKVTHNPHIIGKHLDLASLESVRNLAKDINESEPRLDILFNNAGIGDGNISYTSDGLEKSMQINYFGHFLLTHLLIDLLKKSAPSRIVSSSSLLAYALQSLSVENLNPKENFGSLKNLLLSAGTYGTSKLCIALATKMFAEKLAGTGVTVNTFHPGGAKTNIYNQPTRTWRDFIRLLLGLLIFCYGKTPEEAAQTPLYLAQADEVANITGKFFMEGRSVFMPFQLNDRKFCEKVWERSILYTKLEPHEVKC